MALDYQVLDWLNENARRWYPLKQSYNNAVELRLNVSGDHSLHIKSNGEVRFDHFGELIRMVNIGDSLIISSSAQEFCITSIDLAKKILLVDPAPADTIFGESTLIKAAGRLDGIDYNFDRVPDSQGITIQSIILDANLVFSGQVISNVSLESIILTGNDVAFNVRSSLGLQTLTLVSKQAVSYPYYCRNDQGSLLVIGESVLGLVRNCYFNRVYFEDTVCHYFYGKWKGVTQLAFNDTVIGYADLEFTDGLQFKTAVNPSTRKIFLGANPAYGDPLPCQSFFLGIGTASYVPCEDVVSAINGVTPTSNFGDFKLNTGSNVVVFPDKEHHRLFLGLSFDKTDICQPQPTAPSPNIL